MTLLNHALLDEDLFRHLLDTEQSSQEHLDLLAKSFASVDLRFEPFADLEKSQDRFCRLFRKNIFFPAPAILSEGIHNQPVLFRHTALSIDDNFERIFSALKRTSLFLQNGVRVALDFSALRAERSLIRSSHLQSVGPVRFMELFERAPQKSASPTTIDFMLPADHLDILSYLDYAAQAPAHVRCGLALSENFFQSLSLPEIGLKHKKESDTSRLIAMPELLQRITGSILTGHITRVLFCDQLEEFKNVRNLSTELQINSQNQLALAGEFIAAGALNLKCFVNGSDLDLAHLNDCLFDAVHFLDNAFENNFYFDDESRQLSKRNLRLGLCLFGFDDVLNELSPNSHPQKRQKLGGKIIETIFAQMLRASQKLGEKRGMQNHVWFRGRWHPARHCQLLTQIHMPVLNQIMNSLPYLQNLSGAPGAFSTQGLTPWQNDFASILSLPCSKAGLDVELLKSLIQQSRATGQLVLDFV